MRNLPFYVVYLLSGRFSPRAAYDSIRFHAWNYMIPFDSIRGNGMKLSYGIISFHAWNCRESHVALDSGRIDTAALIFQKKNRFSSLNQECLMTEVTHGIT